MTRRSLSRALILRLRVSPLAPGEAVDPFSLEHLYLAQQKRRLALSIDAGRLRPRNILLFPILAPMVVLRVFDLWMTNEVVRALINEHDLLERVRRGEAEP